MKKLWMPLKKIEIKSFFENKVKSHQFFMGEIGYL